MMKWLCLFMLIPAFGWAQENYTSRLRKDEVRPDRMATFIRAGLTAHTGVQQTQDKGLQEGSTSANDKQVSPGTAAVYGLQLDFGRGFLSFETGISQLTLPLTVTLKRTDEPNKVLTFATTNSYFGFPLLLKYNYIEAPKNVFFVKAGIMAAFLQNGGEDVNPAAGELRNNVQSTTLNTQENFGLLSLGGTAPVTSMFSFTLEATYLRGLAPATGNGDVNEAVLMGAGVLIFL